MLYLFANCTMAKVTSTEKWNIVNAQFGVVASKDGNVAMLSNAGFLFFTIGTGSCVEGDVDEQIYEISVDSTLVKMQSVCLLQIWFHMAITDEGRTFVFNKFTTLKEVKVFNSTFTTKEFNAVLAIIYNQKPAI